MPETPRTPKSFALLLADTIASDRARTHAWRRIGSSLRRAGNFRAARSVLRQALANPPPYEEFERVEWLTEMAEEFVSAGGCRQARKILEEAHLTASTLNVYQKETGLALVAIAFARAGDPWRAATIAKQFPDGEYEIWIQKACIQAFAKVGELIQALSLGAKFNDSVKSWAWVQVAFWTAKAGDGLLAGEFLRQALIYADQIQDPSGRCSAKLNVARALADGWDIQKARSLAEEALIVADQAEDYRSRGNCYFSIAEVLKKIGDKSKQRTILRRAIDHARQIEAENDRRESLTEIAVALSQAGEPDELRTLMDMELTLVREDQDVPSVVGKLDQIASTFLKGGDLERALTVLWRARMVALKARDMHLMARVAPRLAVAGQALEAANLARNCKTLETSVLENVGFAIAMPYTEYDKPIMKETLSPIERKVATAILSIVITGF